MTTPAPPVTLTPGQFAKTSAAAKPGATYAKYQKFIAARRGGNSTPAPPQDPYSGIIGSLPQPETSQQMGSEAQSEISPIVAAIVSAITKQTKGATGAISGYSNDAAAKLAAINYGEPYTQGEGAQAATDATLAAAESGQGLSDANSLQQRLAVINDPSVAAAAANVAGNGAANGNAALSQGSASASNLIANAAAAKDYGQKQPGIQRAQGLQDIAGVEQTGQANIASGTTAAEQQLPSILSSLRSENDNRSSAIASARENQLARNDAIASGAAANQVKVETVNANNATKVQIAQMNQAGKVSAEQLAQARSDRTYRLSFTKTFGYDPVTGRVAPGFKQTAGGQIVKVGTGAGNPGGVPASTYAGLKTKAGKAADLFYYGQAPVTRSDGTVSKAGIPGIDYGTALKQLMSEYSLNKQDALTILNTYYKPGERGRPAAPPPKPIVQPKRKGDIGVTVQAPNGQQVK